LGALSDGAGWAPGGKASVDHVLATVGPAGAEIVRLLAEKDAGLSGADRNEALANIAALGGVEGLQAAAIAAGDRGGGTGGVKRARFRILRTNKG
jgi:hypothetical protein